MDFTGYSSRTLLDLKKNNFLFEKLSIHELGYHHKIIFSGENKKFQFSFSGQKITDDSNRFFWSYNSGESLDFLVKFNNSKYSYYVNSNLISDGYKDEFKLEKLIVDTSGNGISFEPYFYSEKIDLNINITTDSFSSGENVNFKLDNLSAAKIEIESVSFKNLHDDFEDLSFQENQTGFLSGFQTLNFVSKDQTQNNTNYKNFQFITHLTTNAGLFSKVGFANRVNPDLIEQTNYLFIPEIYVDHLFGGEAGFNAFTFSRSHVYTDLLLKIEKVGGDMKSLDAYGFLEFELAGVSGLHTGVFITGINISNSGLYSLPPEVVFSTFSGVSSISVNEKNLISYDAGDSFSLVFSGNGTGISGRALTKKNNIRLFEAENPSSRFRTITGVELDSNGYGFNSNKYSVSLPGSVTDYLKTYADPLASQLGYAPVEFTSKLFVTAGAASGRSVLSADNPGRVSGVILTGPGSGYDKLFQAPSLSFSRVLGDAYANFGSNIASGSCVLNSSGEQIGFDNWEVLASRSFSKNTEGYNLPLSSISGKYYFEPVLFNEDNKELWLKINSTNSTLYSDNGLKFTFYETGKSGKFFSVFSRNTYSIQEAQEDDAVEDMVIDVYDSEEE